MQELEGTISMLDYILNSKRKRHIAGGFLLSAAMLFGGLAITVMTIKNEEGEANENE
ncbi:MAG: histidine kinase [Eubacteriales bacterium]|nr:histidine kinase [Eubacteriales bacterium]